MQNKIEITPEMVEAGVTAYYDAPEWAKDGELPEGAVKRIYRAMEAARIGVGQRHQSVPFYYWPIGSTEPILFHGEIRPSDAERG